MLPDFIGFLLVLVLWKIVSNPSEFIFSRLFVSLWSSDSSPLNHFFAKLKTYSLCNFSSDRSHVPLLYLVFILTFFAHNLDLIESGSAVRPPAYLTDVVKSFQWGLSDFIPKQRQRAWTWALCPGSVILSPAVHSAFMNAELHLPFCCPVTQ